MAIKPAGTLLVTCLALLPGVVDILTRSGCWQLLGLWLCCPGRPGTTGAEFSSEKKKTKPTVFFWNTPTPLISFSTRLYYNNSPLNCLVTRVIMGLKKHSVGIILQKESHCGYQVRVEWWCWICFWSVEFFWIDSRPQSNIKCKVTSEQFLFNKTS